MEQLDRLGGGGGGGGGQELRFHVYSSEDEFVIYAVGEYRAYPWEHPLITVHGNCLHRAATKLAS